MRNLKIIVKTIDDGVSLDTVFVRSFDDDYHKDTEYEGDELYQEARQIRRRYRSFSEFYHAQSVFLNYMERLIEKYGGLDLLEASFESGALNEFIPPIPRMRDTKSNRRIMNLGIPVSTTYTGKMKIDFESIEEIVDDMRNNSPVQVIRMDSVMPNIDSQEIFERSKVIKPNIGALSNMSSLEAIERYIHGTKMEKKARESHNAFFDQDFSIDDMYEGKYVISEEDDGDEFVLFRGKPISKKDHKIITLTTQLGKLGWDSTKLLRQMKGGKDNRLTEVARGIRKDEKSRRKREKRRRKAMQADNAFFSDIMGFDDVESFNDYETDMLNVSMDTIMR